MTTIIKPAAFRIFDEGVDVEQLYNAEYWWLDGEGRAWIRVKDTQKIHEVIGEHVEVVMIR